MEWTYIKGEPKPDRPARGMQGLDGPVTLPSVQAPRPLDRYRSAIQACSWADVEDQIVAL